MWRTKIKQKFKKKQVFEFIRYNLASMVFFYSTLGLFFIFDHLTSWQTPYKLALASLIAHGIYFWLSHKFVFDQDGRRRSTAELWRFGIFMGINYFINIGIVSGLEAVGINAYLGQFLAVGFFMFWTFLGFKLWVFRKVETLPKKTMKRRHA